MGEMPVEVRRGAEPNRIPPTTCVRINIAQDPQRRRRLVSVVDLDVGTVHDQSH